MNDAEETASHLSGPAEAPREGEQKYRHLFEALNDAAFLADAETGFILEANKQAEALLGRPCAEIVGMHQSELHPPGKAGEYRQMFAAHIAEGHATDFDGEIVRKDGTIVPVAISASTLTIGERHVILGLFRDITERKRAEEALQESVEKYRKLVEDSTDGVVVTQGPKITFANQAAIRLLGCSSHDELIGHNFTEFLTPEWRSPVTERALAREKGQYPPSRYELKALRKDGTVFDAEVSVSLIDHQGAVAHQAVVRDITECKQMQEALRESEEKYRSLVENLHEGIWVIDAEGNTTFVNSKMAEMLGYTPDEMLGKHLFSFMDERGVEIAKRNIERRKQGVIEQHDFEFLRKDGSRVYTSVATGPTFDSDGNYAGAHAAVSDITERKRAEEALAQQTSLLETILRQAAEAIVVCDAHGEVTFANPAARRLALMEPEGDMPDISPSSWGQGHYPDGRLVPQEGWLLKAALRGEVMQGAERLMVRADGSSYYLLISAAPLKTPRGDILGAVATFQDITERKHREESLRIRDWAIQSSINAIAFADLDGHLTYVNPSFLRLWGYDEETEVIGRHVLEFWQDEGDAAAVVETLRRNGHWAGELVGKKRGGTPLHLQLTASSVLDGNGEPVAMMASFVDITERRQAEQGLRQSEQRYRLLAENATDVIWTTDLDLRLTYLSPSLIRVLGYTPDELTGRSARKVLTPASLGRARQVLAEVLAEASAKPGEPAPTRTLELEMIRKDGTSVWTESSGSLLLGQEGHPTGVLGVSRDITERKRAENERQRQAAEVAVAYDELMSVKQRLTTHLAILEAANRTVDLEETLQAILDACVEQLGFDSGSIYLVDPLTGDLALRHARGLSPSFLEHVSRFPANAPDPSEALGHDPLFFEHYDTDERLGADPARAAEGPKSVASVPLSAGNIFVGRLNLGSHSHAIISPEMREMLVEATRSVGPALANAIHTQELQRFNRAAAGREDRIIEMKHEVNALLIKLGCEPRYQITHEQIAAR